MPDPAKPANLGDLQTQVKSQILQRISDNFTSSSRLADGTQYTKSDGTNYGMYQKSDDFSALGDVWDRVFSPSSTARAAAAPVAPGPTATKTGG